MNFETVFSVVSPLDCVAPQPVYSDMASVNTPASVTAPELLSPLPVPGPRAQG